MILPLFVFMTLTCANNTFTTKFIIPSGFYLLGEAGGKLLPQTLQLPPPPPQIFATSSTFYIVVEVGPTLVSRMPQLLHHMGRGTPSSPCVLPYLHLNTDSFSPKFQILDRTLTVQTVYIYKLTVLKVYNIYNSVLKLGY